MLLEEQHSRVLTSCISWAAGMSGSGSGRKHMVSSGKFWGATAVSSPWRTWSRVTRSSWAVCLICIISVFISVQRVKWQHVETHKPTNSWFQVQSSVYENHTLDCSICLTRKEVPTKYCLFSFCGEFKRHLLPWSTKYNLSMYHYITLLHWDGCNGMQMFSIQWKMEGKLWFWYLWSTLL